MRYPRLHAYAHGATPAVEDAVRAEARHALDVLEVARQMAPDLVADAERIVSAPILTD